MEKYLFETANFEDFSCSSKISTLLKLAKLDLEGTTIGALVSSCCALFPKKEAIESLVELGNESESEEKVVQSVIEFHSHQGFNCLTVIFSMANAYRNENNEYPSGPMLIEIEESCLFLIQLAKSAKLDLEKILNHTAESGHTLFFLASIFSETITEQLLSETNDHGKMIVRVNSINDLFASSYFRVRLKL